MAVKTAPHSASVTMPTTSGQAATRGAGTSGATSNLEAVIHHLIG